MFKIGDIIVYGAQGICRIDSTEEKQIGKTNVNYYVLKPIFNQNTSVFVPVENAALTAKMIDVLSKTQASQLMQKANDISLLKFAAENDKQTEYKAILASGDRERLLALIKTIRAERDVRRENGKKLNIIDEQTLRKAETLFYNEMAFVYDVAPDEVKNIINF
ncbi:MAG: CarD family transcriptional regulator [Clostridia bacterium]|nr:CarD family transcriptional regulator [Clostridia bacterium]